MGRKKINRENGPPIPVSSPGVRGISFWDFVTLLGGINDPDRSQIILTPPQCAIWKSYDRQVEMTEEEAEAYRVLTGKPPWEVGSEAPPYMLLALHRGGGKTMLNAFVSLYEALTNPYIGRMPGETRNVIVLSTLVLQANLILNYANGICDTTVIGEYIVDAIHKVIRINGGREVVVTASSGDAKGTRGMTAMALIIDEAAFLTPTESEDVFDAATSASRNNEYFRCLMTSSVNGKQGAFWEKFDAFHSVDDEFYEVFHGPADKVYPHVLVCVDAKSKKRDSIDAYNREYMCDWEAGSGTQKFFDYQQILPCIEKGVVEVPSQGASAQYCCAVDPTGGSNDTMTCVVVERMENGEVRQCLAKGWDPKSSPISVHSVAFEIAKLIAPYGLGTVYGDIFGGAWVAEAFVAAGLSYETRGMNGTQKVQRASLLRELFQTQKIHLLDHDETIKELRDYESKLLPSGQISVNHPSSKDGSDDYIDSLAMATWELVGHDVKLHPPEQLQTYNEKNHYKMYNNDKYPNIYGKGPVLSYDEIAAGGSGPKWIIDNWSKNWRTALLSVGELSHTAGIGPFPLVNHIGEKIVLEHAWMRWILADWCKGKDNIDIIFKNDIKFPDIQAWPEILKQIKKQGIRNVVTYESCGGRHLGSGDIPDDWQTCIVMSDSEAIGMSKQSATPPWTKPISVWGIDKIIKEIGGWQDKPWKRAVRDIFSNGNRIKMGGNPRRHNDFTGVNFERHW